MTCTVASPCVAICRLDDKDTCTGCGRHLDEIARWRAMDDDQRRAVLARIAAANRDMDGG
ncbi:MAG: DUF1289 domain-containing protein [Porticoccaceae bacterium]|jgi:predicted Fe-S protein YdhL (DUF1289 family)|nr:DUF1289 domain-containing protein [Porticoccaceae bacterium]MEA3299818.1 DUF1289 domain-containing protein [Pseudomonadota bacterium]HLS99603.1 DUF1289 domain-containing protein [Porticoccaceae bacterium]